MILDFGNRKKDGEDNVDKNARSFVTCEMLESMEEGARDERYEPSG